MSAQIIHLVPFLPRAEPVEAPPRRTAGELRLINEAHEMAVNAIRSANAHQRDSNPRLAKSRLLTASTDLTEMWLDCGIPEIDELAGAMARRANEIRLERRRHRMADGIAGFLR